MRFAFRKSYGTRIRGGIMGICLVTGLSCAKDCKDCEIAIGITPLVKFRALCKRIPAQSMRGKNRIIIRFETEQDAIEFCKAVNDFAHGEM